MPEPFTSDSILYPSDTFVHRHIGPSETEISAMLAAVGCKSLNDRDGLLRLHHAAGDSEKHSRKPGLVHAVHAVSGGDRAGPAGGAAQFPDDGGRPDRAAAGECVLAG